MPRRVVRLIDLIHRVIKLLLLAQAIGGEMLQRVRASLVGVCAAGQQWLVRWRLGGKLVILALPVPVRVAVGPGRVLDAKLLGGIPTPKRAHGGVAGRQVWPLPVMNRGERKERRSREENEIGWERMGGRRGRDWSALPECGISSGFIIDARTVRPARHEVAGHAMMPIARCSCAMREASSRLACRVESAVHLASLRGIGSTPGTLADLITTPDRFRANQYGGHGQRHWPLVARRLRAASQLLPLAQRSHMPPPATALPPACHHPPVRVPVLIGQIHFVVDVGDDERGAMASATAFSCYPTNHISPLPTVGCHVSGPR